MAKFYVQSGNFRRVVTADSTRKAAIWAVHEVMQQILPTDEAPSSSTPSAANREPHEPQAITVLSGKVRVNEQGFDRSDAREISTMEIVAEWNQMIMTLDRLQQMFGSVSDAKASVPPVDDQPRFGDGMAA